MKMMRTAALDRAALEVFRPAAAAVERARAGDARRASPLQASVWRGTA